jgi:serine palmitoyltransferase
MDVESATISVLIHRRLIYAWAHSPNHSAQRADTYENLIQIAASKAVIDHLRLANHSAIYAEPIAVPVLRQITSSMRIILGEIGGHEGRLRVQSLARNSKFFATELKKMGFIIYGGSSPVIPLLIFHPAKIPAFSREMLKRGIAVVVVGYPATPIITSRVRFCISASHTMEDLEFALKMVSEVGDLLHLKIAQ